VNPGSLAKQGTLLNKTKVLLVDDDPVILTAVAEFLHLEGYSVVQVANLQSAYVALEKILPTLQ